MRTAVFWAITQRVVVIPYRGFGTTYVPSSVINNTWIIGPFKKGPIGCPETSLRNCHCSLHNSREGSYQGVVNVFFSKRRRVTANKQVLPVNMQTLCW
jgi:hypothetical protein